MIEPGRPNLPPGYGLKSPTEGRLIQWSQVVAKLAAARNYWIATASPQGIPHAAPVWGIWHRDSFYFGTDPKSRKAVNLAGNNAVVLHLESGDDVVILEGSAHKLSEADVHGELDGAYFAKYGFHLKGNPTYRIEPQRAFAWAEADFPESATRWQFPDTEQQADA